MDKPTENAHARLDQRGEVGLCTHEITTRLREAGEYGSTNLTDWHWCAGCGAVRVVGSNEWSLPANGTVDKTNALNQAREQLRLTHIDWQNTLTEMEAWKALAERQERHELMCGCLIIRECDTHGEIADRDIGLDRLALHQANERIAELEAEVVDWKRSSDIAGEVAGKRQAELEQVKGELSDAQLVSSTEAYDARSRAAAGLADALKGRCQGCVERYPLNQVDEALSDWHVHEGVTWPCFLTDEERAALAAYQETQG